MDADEDNAYYLEDVARAAAGEGSENDENDEDELPPYEIVKVEQSTGNYLRETDNFNVELFLKHICECPSLYDTQKRGYNNRLIKDKAWEKIAQSMDASTQFCKAKWKSLREKYNRERQKEENSSRNGAGANFMEPWEYMSYFKFMYDNAEPREKSSSFHVTTTSVRPKVSITGRTKMSTPIKISTPITSHPGAHSKSVLVVESTPKSPKRLKKRKLEESPEQNFVVLQQISESLEKISKEEEPQDKIECWSKYLAAELRDLPLTVQQEFMDSTIINLLTLKRQQRKPN